MYTLVAHSYFRNPRPIHTQLYSIRVYTLVAHCYFRNVQLNSQATLRCVTPGRVAHELRTSDFAIRPNDCSIRLKLWYDSTVIESWPGNSAGGIEMSEIKNVTREGFENRDAAFTVAKRFTSIGGKIIEGGERADGLWGWSGSIRVDDTCKSVAGTFRCGRCAATGQFITGSLNGKPTGPGGICFRCDGKGVHTQADRKRNLYHDIHAFCKVA